MTQQRKNFDRAYKLPAACAISEMRPEKRKSACKTNLKDLNMTKQTHARQDASVRLGPKRKE